MSLEAAILHLKQDLVLKKVIQETSLTPFTPSGDVYYDLLNSIASQQLNVSVATRIFDRFCALFPDAYPSPQLVSTIDPDTLRTAGLSRQKAGYMKNVADFTMEYELEKYNWESYSNEEIIDLLTRIKGVGKWTVEMILMFTIGRPDVFPVDDLGIQQAMVALYKIPERGKLLRENMVQIAEPWRPWRTVACRYLWRWKNEN